MKKEDGSMRKHDCEPIQQMLPATNEAPTDPRVYSVPALSDPLKLMQVLVSERQAIRETAGVESHTI